MEEAIEKAKKSGIRCLPIFGQVEGHFLLPDTQKVTKYEEILPLLIGLEESAEVEGILVLLNTMGGDVEAGLAIAECIASLSKPTVSLVLGGGHSIGVPLAVAADVSFIVPSATMTVHPVRVNGTVIGVPQTYRHFREMQDRIFDFVASHSKIPKEKLIELSLSPDDMANDVGSILGGREAVEVGIIDAVGGISDALGTLHGRIGEKGSQNG